jgi:glycosyltransferase involved in cell wall biosynthesis
MKKKICMIGTQFIGVPTNCGGAIEYLSFKLAEKLREKFSVTYFSVDPSIKFNSENLVIERFPAKKTNAFLFTLFVAMKSLPKKFHAVYLSGCSMIFAALIVSRLKRIPLIYHEFNHNPWIKPNNFLYDFLSRFSVKCSDYVIVPNAYIEKQLVKQTGINKSKVFVLSNFVDLKEFPSSLPKKEKKILFVGRAVKHKGISFLARLLEENYFNDWVFHLVFPKFSSREERRCFQNLNLLKRSVKAKFSLKCNLSRKQLVEEFSSASILVLPSSQEAFGLVLIEAMASFTPCIAFSVGGIPEIIDDNKNGFLVELNNFRLFKEKLRELMNNEKKRVLFGLNARQKVEEKFSFAVKAKEFNRFFSGVLGQNNEDSVFW